MKPLPIAVALLVAIAVAGCDGEAAQWPRTALLKDSTAPESCIAPEPAVPTARNIGNAPPVSDGLFGDERC